LRALPAGLAGRIVGRGRRRLRDLRERLAGLEREAGLRQGQARKNGADQEPALGARHGVRFLVEDLAQQCARALNPP
jgi:hypothetical protein